MGGSNSLGERMKDYESITRNRLPRRAYTIMRLDGRSFSSYTRGCEKPYDATLMADMDAVAEALCKEISGTVCAFTQSDEVSLLITDLASSTTQPWFDGGVQKMVSVAASIAAAEFNLRRWETVKKVAAFDARVFTLPNPMEVANYFVWRQRDCTRNSISMAARAVFSHREMIGVSANQAQEKLWTEKAINWNDYPVGAKRGRVTTRVTGEEPVAFTHKGTGERTSTIATRSRWVTEPAPTFTADPEGFLAAIIPPQVSLAA